MARVNTDVSGVEPQRSFQPLPAGTYTAQITKSELLSTKAGNGHYLKLEFTILDADDPKLVSRKVFVNLNLDNPKQQAVEIAYAELSAICHAIGHNGKVGDSEELHGQPMEIDITIREDASGKYQPSNEINGYRPVSGGATTAGKPAAKPAGNTPPWAK